MLALYRCGRQAEALAAYREARHLLVEELGLEPSQPLQGLEKAILVQDPSLAVAPVADDDDLAPGQMPGKRHPSRLGWLARRQARAGLLLTALLLAGGIAAAVVELSRGPASLRSLQGNSLAVIDADSGKLTSQIPVGAAPAGVRASRDAIWVTNTDDQTVSQIDPRTNAVVQTIQVGAGPAGIAIGAGAVWVVNALDGTVSRIDPKTRAVVQTVPVGNGPTAIAYGLGALWVANGGDLTVSKIEPTSGKPVRTFAAGPGASGIATGFGSVWVTSERTGNVSRLDPRTGMVERTINVGNGPRAVAVGAGSVWVANGLDGTVSRVDPETNAVGAVISTAAGPSDIAVGPHTIWVANDVGAVLTRIDPATNRVVRIVRLDNPPEGLALVGGSVLAAVREQALAHRGGTLTVESGRRGLQSIDPAISYESYNVAIPSLTSDGLVAFKYAGGSNGSTLVPDLATSLPSPTDAGKAYTFKLRPGIRYSTGRVVHAQDFRHSIERLFRLRFGGRGFFSGIVGAARCDKAPKTCDLSKGIVVDAAARSVTYHLVAPDPDFLYKLTAPAANPAPPGVPNRDMGTRPVPGTGPYKIAHYVPNKELVFDRNPYFRVWSQAAMPDGFPDRIVWRLDVTAAAATRAVEKGQADVAYDFVPPELLTEVKTRYASQLHLDPIPGTFFYLLDARLPPFGDVRVRRALNYAVDRDAVTKIAGEGVAQATCQVLPPNFTAYRPYCPYTASPSASGRWLAPDLERAKQLVAASGTKGESVTVWTPVKAEGEYLASVLRHLGYRTRVRAITPLSRYDAVVLPRFFDRGNTIQIAELRWYPDYPAASGFINNTIFDCTYFCDRRIDRAIAHARAQQVTDPQAANALWAQIDRDLTDQAPWLFLYNPKQADFVSSRVANFQYNLQYGVLLDQLWLR
jgi:YVTN family beta-propeller protein